MPKHILGMFKRKESGEGPWLTHRKGIEYVRVSNLEDDAKLELRMESVSGFQTSSVELARGDNRAVKVWLERCEPKRFQFVKHAGKTPLATNVEIFYGVGS